MCGLGVTFPPMTDNLDTLGTRLAHVERQLRTFKVIAAVAIVAAIALALMPRPEAQQSIDVLRVKQVVVEDAEGRGRIVLGYLDAGSTRRFGLRINDPAGDERLGLSYMENGNFVLGLDAPRGTGEDRNRERITLVTEAKGGAYLRFLDRRTSLAARMYLDPRNRVWMEFSDYAVKPSLVRRYGLSGEEEVKPEP